MKVSIATAKNKKVKPRDDDDDEDEDSPVIATVSKSSKAQPAQLKQGVEYLQIAMLKNIPSPRVGTWIGEDELGKKLMKKNRTYTVPKNVAFHLKDIKACVIVGENDDDESDDQEDQE